MTDKIQSALSSYEMILSFENFALETDGAGVMATSEVSVGSLTVEGLLSPALDTAWRSGSVLEASSESPPEILVRWTLGGPRAVDWVGFHRHNIRQGFKVRLYSADPALGATPNYESAWLDPVVRARPNEFDTFTEMPWTLGPSDEELDRLSRQFRLDSFHQADKTYKNVRWVELVFDASKAKNYDYRDPTNRDDDTVDYFQVGFPMIGRVFRPRINMVLDWDHGLEDRSQTHRTESGALHGRRRSMGRTFAFTLPYLDNPEAFRRVFTEWVRRYGKLGRLFAWPEPHKRRYFFDTAMVCTVVQLPKIAMANLDWPSANGFLLEETE